MSSALALLAVTLAGSAVLYATDRVGGYRAGGVIGIAVIVLVALKVVARI